jgi:putative aminopeptidase FrvX
MDSTEALLRELSEAHGVSGYEGDVAAIVRRHMAPLSTVQADRVGSVIGCLSGEGPRVMLAGHMDEVGFMVSHITKEGCLRFLNLGGWWDQVLLGQRVVVKTRKGDLLGVIGAKPPHLLPPEDRKDVVTANEMYIDVGATSADQVQQAGVRPGDPVVPTSDFQVLMGGRTYIGKALDDRIGVALAIDLVRHFATHAHPNQVFAAATAMEEVGCRGAKTCSAVIEPDVAIILEVDLCGDVPGIKPEESSIRLGGGPSLWLLDAQMIPSLPLRNLVIDTAEEMQIPLQFSAYTRAATDGAHTHLHGAGVPTVVIGVPTRHVHSHSAIMHRDDYDRALQLLIALVGKLDAQAVASL